MPQEEQTAMIIVDGLPLRKAFKEPMYYAVKTRNGLENRNYLGLPVGEHEVKFCGKRKTINTIVKIWINPFGIAYQIFEQK